MIERKGIVWAYLTPKTPPETPKKARIEKKRNPTSNNVLPVEIVETVDESLVPLPPELAHLEGIVTAHKYRNGHVYKGGKYSTGILDEISNKLNRNKSVVINVSGPPGIGKTWFAMAFAQFFDPGFHVIDAPAPDPWTDTGQICFTRDHIKFLVGENSPLKRGSAIVIDEGHFGLGARGFQNKDQISIVNLIAAIRSKGFMLIIVTQFCTTKIIPSRNRTEVGLAEIRTL